ncbi:SWIB/MDM2 domain-containing protein [Syncephalastrum racemosum]|uniref:SWIB/MDM2 domain-containing protein n=1 Tax=Syncephalastrum racemosum TaxID=13706 RepID=A0A1X2HVQ6_SYNRA|nr:SWIB/MDM2 domain-containing protein [Syncephalastrum racemosum]
MDIQSLKPIILDILRGSDLSTVSVKQVRQELQFRTDIPLEQHKKELKQLITDCFSIVTEENENDSGSEEEEEEEEETSAPKKVTTPKPKSKPKPKTQQRKRKADTEDKPKRRRVQDPATLEKNPFTRTWILSPEMAALTGEEKLSRPGVVKHVWKHIKENNLQDPNKKTNFFCDDQLKKIFGESYMSGFAMNKNEYIGKHLLRPAVEDPVDGSTQE